MTLTQKDIEKRFEEHHSRIHKVETDMYFGDGVENPPLTARLLKIETAVAKIDKLTWAVIIGIIAAIGDVISHHY